ncbi:MAG: hypothetical protein K6E51_12625 [Treponema sp.]|nr:hypothetical protein [Treponema sp.]
MKIIVVFVLMYIFSFSHVCAQSTSGNTIHLTLSDIDAVIAETRYDTALQMLNEYMRAFPDQFDDAQKRVRKIMLIRDHYIKLADHLLDVMEHEPENNKKKLDIIAELESLEKHPSEDHLLFIQQAKIAAQFTYYRSIFNRIMEQGHDLIVAKNYQQALELFISGLDLYQDDFFDQTESEEIKAAVQTSVTELEQSPVLFKNIPENLTTAVDVFISDVAKGDIDKSRKSFLAVQKQFSLLALLRNQVAMCGSLFENTFTQLQAEDSSLMDASFLPFASRFTLGKKDDANTGALGSIDALWNNETERMKQAVLDEVHVACTTFTASLSQEELLTGKRVITVDSTAVIRDFLQLGIQVNELYGLRISSGREVDNLICSNFSDGMIYGGKLLDALCNQSVDMQLFQQRVKQEPAVLDNKILADEKLQFVVSYEELLKNCFLRLHDNWFLMYQKGIEGERRDGLFPSMAAGDILYDYHPVLAELDSFFVAFENESYRLIDQQIQDTLFQLSTFYSDDSDGYVKKYRQGFMNAQTLVDKAQPTNALGCISDLQSDYAKDRAIVREYELYLEKKQKDRDALVQPFYDHVVSCGVTMDSFVFQLDDVQKEALDKQQKAVIAKNEGDMRYQQAVQLLKKENFAEARTNLQRSRIKFNESLSYENSEEIQNYSDALLLELGMALTKAENRIVVGEVRQLKKQAKNEYYNANFEKAQALLLQAKSRWELTNIEPDEEIASLMALISTALTMKSGRVILSTAPLYPEMSQILSIAHQYYDQGKQLIAEGKRDKAEVVLQQAKEKIHELQLVYPLNQEAGILSLQIDQLIDKQNFDVLFAEKIKTAKINYKRPELQQESYTTLLDLYEIYPDYPDLKKLIYDVEIELGIRQKPVEKTSIEKADTLLAQAKKIVASAKGNPDELRKAIKTLDSAIALNPNLSAAMDLKDKIQLDIGGTAAVVLTSADERQYQLAIQELQKNNIIGANSIVEQLLQTPANRRSSKILELQKKVKALL